MGIEVEFISKEFIKPSSPTPHHLSKFQLSFIDQLQHPVSMPFVLFYENSNISIQERSNFFKQSLSKALTLFYPLAGRINNNSYVDCNDEGTLFIEAKANCKLSDILGNRNQYHNHFKKFVPLQPDKSGVHQYGSLFQITYFNCGGLAVSFTMPHMLGDGLSQLSFLNSWAAVARGDAVDAPSLASDSVFPCRKISGFGRMEWAFKGSFVTKPFVFDAFTISSLRDKYSTNGEKLSRVQALSVFILNRIMNTVSQANDKGGLVINLMNLRPIVEPPISYHSFGNLIWMAVAAIDKEDEGYEIGRKIRNSIKSVNGETVKKIQSDEQLDFLKETFGEFSNGEMKKYTFSSLCNFPVYEIDFGWGKPEWVTTSGMTVDNILVIFLDTKEGQGMEAWISMTEEDMAKFENDNQLISHLSSTLYGNQNLIKQSRL